MTIIGSPGSTRMKEKEIVAAQENGYDPQEYTVAIDALAVVVNPENPVSELTIDQLSDIFTGRVVNWLDGGCQYYPSYWGQKNIKYSGSGYFRPSVSFDEAVGAAYPVALKALYVGE